MSNQFSDQHMALMNTVKNSGAIDFKKLGDLVTQVTPQLFDPSIAADNYIASGYSDVVKVWKQRTLDQSAIESVANVQGMVRAQGAAGAKSQ